MELAPRASSCRTLRTLGVYLGIYSPSLHDLRVRRRKLGSSPKRSHHIPLHVEGCVTMFLSMTRSLVVLWDLLRVPNRYGVKSSDNPDTISFTLASSLTLSSREASFIVYAYKSSYESQNERVRENLCPRKYASNHSSPKLKDSSEDVLHLLEDDMLHISYQTRPRDIEKRIHTSFPGLSRLKRTLCVVLFTYVRCAVINASKSPSFLSMKSINFFHWHSMTSSWQYAWTCRRKWIISARTSRT